MPKLIAIVEDDPDQRANYSDAIVQKGYEVAVYSSRAEALDGFDAGFEKGVLTGNTTNAKTTGVKVKFGDATCPGGVDMAGGRDSIRLQAACRVMYSFV